ncbi:universal stress protein [Thermoleptolyngbya sp.]
MKIKSMLMRLQNALGQPELVEQMLLASGKTALETAETQSDETVNLVIGYNGSPNSQVALDLTLWIAHQTRLATQKQVMVHVVYVVDSQSAPFGNQLVHGRSPQAPQKSQRARSRQAATPERQTERVGSTLTLPRLTPANPFVPLNTHIHDHANPACLTDCHISPAETPAQNLLEQADCILWQARCLAEEWRGSLEAHLRFGATDAELNQVAEEVGADLMVLGCSTKAHPLISKLRTKTHCPILGIPEQLAGIRQAERG